MPKLRSSPLNANPNSPTPPLSTTSPDQNEPQVAQQGTPAGQPMIGGTGMIRRAAPGMAAAMIPPPALPPDLAAMFAQMLGGRR